MDAAGPAKGGAVSEAHPVDGDAVEDSTRPPREETKPDARAGSGVSEGDGGTDEEERRARETIALLAKKYQVRGTINTVSRPR